MLSFKPIKPNNEHWHPQQQYITGMILNCVWKWDSNPEALGTVQ